MDRCSPMARIPPCRALCKGGSGSVDNIELRCRAHNVCEAERDFGPWTAMRVRETAPAYASNRTFVHEMLPPNVQCARRTCPAVLWQAEASASPPCSSPRGELVMPTSKRPDLPLNRRALDTQKRVGVRQLPRYANSSRCGDCFHRLDRAGNHSPVDGEDRNQHVLVEPDRSHPDCFVRRLCRWGYCGPQITRARPVNRATLSHTRGQHVGFGESAFNGNLGS